MYWNPTYNSFTKEPLEERSLEYDQNGAFELMRQAESENKVVADRDGIPVICEVEG